MKTLSTFAVGALALTLMAASPASAQSRDRDRDRDDSTRNAILGAVVGGLAGAAIGNGDTTYIAGGALAGAALGVGASSDRSDCNYYRGGRCYRNQGHWEREHNINSRDGYNRREIRRYERLERRDARRDYRYDPRW